MWPRPQAVDSDSAKEPPLYGQKVCRRIIGTAFALMETSMAHTYTNLLTHIFTTKERLPYLQGERHDDVCAYLRWCRAPA
jgi:hypothetical protein